MAERRVVVLRPIAGGGYRVGDVLLESAFSEEMLADLIKRGFLQYVDEPKPKAKPKPEKKKKKE